MLQRVCWLTMNVHTRWSRIWPRMAFTVLLPSNGLMLRLRGPFSRDWPSDVISENKPRREMQSYQKWRTRDAVIAHDLTWHFCISSGKENRAKRKIYYSRLSIFQRSLILVIEGIYIVYLINYVMCLWSYNILKP